MKKLYYYNVRILRNPGIYEWNKSRFTTEEVFILDSNDLYTVLKDDYFTKLDNKKDSYNSNYIINKPNINIRTNDKFLDNGIFYTLYSEKQVKPAKIKSEIKTKIDKDYSWLLGGIDLSIIK